MTPIRNPDAEFIDIVEKIDSHLVKMAKGSSGSSVGTGGMGNQTDSGPI